MRRKRDNISGMTTNPFLSISELPHEAFPFDKLKKEHFQPALEKGIAEAKTRIEKMKAETSPATFDNTVLVLETASELVSAVSQIFFNLLSAESDDELQSMAKDISPRLAEFSSDITLDEKIFARIKEVYDNRELHKLTGERLRLTEKTYIDFVRNGSLLSDEKKQKLRQIDQKLSTLSPEFSDNVLKATNSFQLHVTNQKDLAGLPEAAIETAALAAKNANLQGWVFTLHGPSLIPFMTYAENRELRQKLWMGNASKAYKDSHDNSSLCIDIATLRHNRAQLLGYKTHAHFVLEERMAESPEKVTAFLERLLEKSMPAGKRDVEQVRALKKELTGDEELMPWDYAFYSEKLKIRDYDFDEEELRPYFKLENVINGVFEHARQLYGLVFKPLSGIPTYHPDVKTFEVSDQKTGKFVGLFYADFFPRKSKRNGAWMTSFRDQGLWHGQVGRPHISIVCNFTEPTATKPSLLTLDEVRTLFHEFGHALHGLLSNCEYVSLSGTNVYWDFVELPSQIMENWVLEKEGLDLFAHHFETGAAIPAQLTEKIKATAKFQAGYSSLRQLQFSLLDMSWHASDPQQIKDTSAFENQMTARTSLLPKIPGTNSSCSFSHIFAGGYSAGYYSYKWAEVLDADAFEFFKEQGLFNQAVATSFKENILSRGGTEHPMQLYKKFRGREPDPDALLRRDGLI
jgi:peptidyl-dipeptidase Dcp